MNTIKWSQSAYISFEEIIKYSIEEHGIRQANRLKKVIASTNVLRSPDTILTLLKWE